MFVACELKHLFFPENIILSMKGYGINLFVLCPSVSNHHDERYRERRSPPATCIATTWLLHCALYWGGSLTIGVPTQLFKALALSSRLLLAHAISHTPYLPMQPSGGQWMWRYPGLTCSLTASCPPSLQRLLSLAGDWQGLLKLIICLVSNLVAIKKGTPGLFQ